MEIINALSMTSAVNDWLVNSRHPQILHVFDRAFNLINEHREVLSIVTPQIGNGPFNLVIADEIRFLDYLNLESYVSISPIQLTLGNLTIYTVNTTQWVPRPDWEMLHIKRDDILNQMISLQGFSFGSNSFPNTEIASRKLATTSAQLQITNYQFSNLLSALVHADISSALKVTSKLAGLGIGLTPAGDDFIMGAIYAAWIIHPPEVASVLAQEIANTAAPLTTSLSAAWLRSTGRGETGILWHQFFNELISADPVLLQDSTKKILAVGETSGADALAGFIGLFIHRGQHCSNL